MADFSTCPVIEIKDVSKQFVMGDNVVHALRNVSLTVKQGEYVGILGPSGSGKSTLMNIIGCMDTYDSGEYKLMSIPVAKLNDRQQTIIRNRLIGFIFQKYHLVSTYTVLQNVMMPLLARGESYKEAEAKAKEKLAMLEMSDRIYHKPNELSGGQQQRAAIARALIGDPKLLLADEPTGALDTKTGEEVLKLFRTLNDMGHTIVMITHDLKVASHAGRIIRIVDGEITEQ
ncbi:MAG: ABC transporter ATP-binding protein [Clostridia bacterium]|nr:ABC transporter ATP-binding protein [Clostridia bacterium]